MKVVNIITGIKIKINRIKKGVTQTELANRIGISRYYLSALERGKAKNPSIKVMRKLSEELGESVQELFF